MRVRIVPFARVLEVVGAATVFREVPAGATAGAVWDELAREFPPLAELAGSTRLARNGRFVDRLAALADGDELALLPPYGGG